MAIAAAGIWGRGVRFGTLHGSALLRPRPRIARDIGVWSERLVGIRASWSCTNHERISALLAEEKIRTGPKHVGQAGTAELRGLRSSTIQGALRARENQARYLSTQRSDDGKTPAPKSSTPLQPPTLTPLPTPHENIYTLPNALTLTRLLSAPLIGHLLLTSSPLPALLLFLYAGLTDLLDGYLARRYSTQTVLGTILDPMADKALMTIVVGVLGYQHVLPLPLAVLILGRDVLLSVAAFWIRWASLPAPRTVRRYWDFSLPSAEVRPSGISKVNTALQVGLIAVTMGGLAFPGLMVGEAARGALEVAWWVVGGTTVWSGVSYLGKGGVRILGKKGG